MSADRPLSARISDAVQVAEKQIPRWVSKLDALDEIDFPDSAEINQLLDYDRETGLALKLDKALEKLGIVDDALFRVVHTALTYLSTPRVTLNQVEGPPVTIGDIRSLTAEDLVLIDGFRGADSFAFGTEATRVRVIEKLFGLPNIVES